MTPWLAYQIPLFPEQASSMAGKVDALYWFLIGVSVFFGTLISVLVIYFAVKYRRSRHRVAVQIEGSVPLELAWTFIPLGIAMFIFVWATVVFFGLRRVPAGAMEVNGVGKQWMWKFQHPQGQREINQLHVPVGRDVKMRLVSQDVIHSFYVPAFRVKMDVLPGRYTTAWFRATKTGTYHLFCAEYCGTAHSGMIGQVVVMEPSQFEAWLAGGKAEGSLASGGEKLFQDLGCVTCHRDDAQARGPSLRGLFGKEVRLQDGRTMTADETYIRESIVNPGAKVVAGFQPIMPVYQGQVTEEGLLQLLAYIRSLAEQPEGTTPEQAAPMAPPIGTSQPVREQRERPGQQPQAQPRNP
jgi:cytochrome c oxidase subunit 2